MQIALARVAALGAGRLAALGMPAPRAQALATLALRVAGGGLRLQPGADPVATLRALREIGGMDA